MKRILIAIFLFILVAFVVTMIFSYRTFKKSLPQTKGTIEIQALNDKVQIYRDKHGIPHIFAQNDHDLYFALGYTIAQDRLWQLDLIRRIVNGRLSEVFGDTTVAIDEFLLTIGFKRIAGELYNTISENSRENIQHYTDGINHYINTNNGKLPIEYLVLNVEPQLWHPEDCLAFSRYMAWELSMSWHIELLVAELKEKLGNKHTNELFGDGNDQWPTIVVDDLNLFNFAEIYKITEQLSNITGLKNWPQGSNNWVIDGTKSESGKPMLANDPHLLLSNPSRWYLVHLIAPGVNVAGFTLPGSPSVVIGFNQNISWGFTNVMTDDADFFIKETDRADSTRYRENDRWEKMQVVAETIPINGKESKRFNIYLCNDGPIINSIHPKAKNSKKKIALKWTGQENSDEVLALYRLNRAKNWTDFQQAIKDFKIPGQNIVYTDVHGNIGYWCSSLIPIRSQSNNEPTWSGFIPFKELPHSYNPSSGYVATANNKVTTKDYPYYISNMWEPPSRISRITELLQQNKRFSLSDFRAFQTDVYSPFAEFLIPLILPELEKLKDVEKRHQRMFEFVKGWDFNVRGESVAASIFHVFLQHFSENTFRDELGKEAFQDYIFFSGQSYRALRNIFDSNLNHWFDNVETKDKKESASEVIKKSWLQAADELEQRFGSDHIKWRWDQLHHVTFKHFLGDQPMINRIFNIGPFPMSGSHTTINNGSYSFKNPYDCIVGPSMRMIIDMANPGRAEVINPPGQVGHPFSNHYRDQADFWVSGLYITLETDTTLIRRSNFDLLELTVPSKN